MAQTKIIYGFHAVMAALEHHPERILNIYYQDREEKENNARFNGMLAKARENSLVLQPISKGKLDNLVQSDHHQGIAAEIRGQITHDTHRVLAWLENAEKPPLLLLLESIQDPHNLGACLRSAEALGVDWVILPRAHSAPMNATVSKVACGADQSIKIAMVPNIVRFIQQIQEVGVWVVGTSGEALIPLSKAPLARSVALVMGAEGKGLKRLTQEVCDEMVKIPLIGTVESLNVSVATGICLYECVRQRST